jgi:hypothetical protein
MMNEKIRELWQQATPIDESRIVGGFYRPYIALQFAGEPTRHTFTEQELENFSKLLIQECISVLDQEIAFSVDRRGDNVEPDLILNKHFGVEE